ncbi:DUF305 domain-containing protein [Microbacterium sp. Bi128]|uniref:DUF305 domain-containing protein n=1 Tax=Microbacterium sp. Bi128 TaxID=2821115 RepID=UPI001DEBBB43|nr:DUF305 domain-containing protein [Microbacterium sp. Bi128]CAH0240366.1 hypothetical protein SRABI128_02666 [Microbacterium sp. Bi128]
MKKYAIVAALFVLATVGSWIVIGTVGVTVPASAPPPARAAQSGAPTAEEVMFVTMMIDHHQQAVRMGEILASAPDVPHRVGNLAEKMQVAQAGEIGDSQKWLAAWAAAAETTGGAHGGHGSSATANSGPATMTMKGMIGPEGFAELEAATGVEAAKVFLRLMIEHHVGAIETAGEITGSLSNPWVVSFAQHLVTEQSIEVASMRRMAESLG